MSAAKSPGLQVGADQPLASADLIAFARQHAATAAGGDVLEQRFRRLCDGSGAEVWLETEVMPTADGGALTRLSILRGTSRRAKRSIRKIAEYEELRAGGEAPPPVSATVDDATDAPRASAESGASSSLKTADIRRRQIVDGACDVISRKGYAEASVREIAEAAGVSIPSLYQYVKSKEDILFLLTEGCMQRLFNEFQKTIGSAISADAKIEKAIEDYLAYISDNRRYINLVYRETRSLSAENRDRIFDIERALMKEWETIVRAGKQAGAFRDIDPILASNILYFACSVWALRHWAISDFSEQETRAALTALLLDGLRQP